MLDMSIIAIKPSMGKGVMSRNLPKEGINIDAVAKTNEPNTASMSHLFLKIPTLSAG